MLSLDAMKFKKCLDECIFNKIIIKPTLDTSSGNGVKQGRQNVLAISGDLSENNSG